MAKIPIYSLTSAAPTSLEGCLFGANLAAADLHQANLSGAILDGADLSRADLRQANLNKAGLTEAKLSHADLTEATLDEAFIVQAILNEAHMGLAKLNRATIGESNLLGADLHGADLQGATLFQSFLFGTDLSGANLQDANFFSSTLIRANLSHANLQGADLEATILTDANLSYANLTDCRVYGTAAWNLQLEGAQQANLVITKKDEPVITVDNLEVAQFVYLLLNNEKIRSIVNTVTTKVVLILGRFTPERKAVLDALREELRKHDYVPIVFDFEKPTTRDLTETVSTLAHMARFVIADLTLPRSIPQELMAIVPDLAVPVQPILQTGVDSEYAMFTDLRRKYHWVLATQEYAGMEDLLLALPERIIAPAEAKARELQD